MNHSIHLFVFVFLGLLAFLISDASAACNPDENCDCDVKGCSCSGFIGARFCGFELGCEDRLRNHIFQCSGSGDICHFGPCTNGCAYDYPNSKCI